MIILFSDDDANINPYATFNELKLVFSENPTYHKPDPDSEEDSVSLEKAEAQKAVCFHKYYYRTMFVLPCI